jgi:hypothetical protein
VYGSITELLGATMTCSSPRIWIVALFAVACGSKTLSPAAARIREGTESDLADCTFLQKVQGAASDSDSNAATHAKNAAREQAAAIGATHIRWIVPCCTSVEADAYRCDVPD